MQDCSDSIANALELLQSRTKPSISSSCGIYMFPSRQLSIQGIQHLSHTNDTRTNTHKDTEFINSNVAGGLYTGGLSSRIATKYKIRIVWGVMTWKRFPHYWTFMRGMNRSKVIFPHKISVMWSFDVSYEDAVEQTVTLSVTPWCSCDIPVTRHVALLWVLWSNCLPVDSVCLTLHSLQKGSS